MIDQVEGDDGMSRPRYRYHRSEKILGQLYRDIDEKKIWSEDIDRHVDKNEQDIWESIIDYAEDIVQQLDLGSNIDLRRHVTKAREVMDL